VRTEVFRAQPARGIVPHAHTMTKAAKTDGIASIVRDPKDLPPPVGKRGPQHVKVDLETVEVTGKLADGASYRYRTFNQKVPGPMPGRPLSVDLAQSHAPGQRGLSAA
jgi:hypothetical protein